MIKINNRDREFYRELKNNKSANEDLKTLFVPNALKSLYSVFLNWVLILVACKIAMMSSWIIPIAILIIASRQRGLSNLVHDASHGNLSRNIRANDILANLFCAFPMLETVTFYKRSHMNHHQFLGDLRKDPDSRNHLRYGYNDDEILQRNFGVVNRLIFNLQSLRDSLMGSFLALDIKDKIRVSIWWFIFLSVMYFLNSEFSLVFICLWLFSKLTTYHVIRLVAEFLDHTGLKVGSQIGFSRTVTGSVLVRFFVHPNVDNYHLAHHLLPRVPHYSLKEAHSKLMQLASYSRASHCDGYIFGNHSALQSWKGGSV